MRRRRRTRGLLAAAALLAAAHGCSVRQGRIHTIAEAPDPATGRTTYERACAPCHGIDGRGTGPVAASLTTPAPDLTLLAARSGGAFPRQEVLDVIRGTRPVAAHGSTEMPVWGEAFRRRTAAKGSGAHAAAALYHQRRLNDLVAYVETLQRTP